MGFLSFFRHTIRKCTMFNNNHESCDVFYFPALLCFYIVKQFARLLYGASVSRRKITEKKIEMNEMNGSGKSCCGMTLQHPVVTQTPNVFDETVLFHRQNGA